MKRRVLYSAIWGDAGPFHSLVDKVVAVDSPREILDTNSYLVVWGGSDINPALYHHPQSKTTSPGGRRDIVEWALMNRAKELGIPIIGICRGAQMLCALAGGFLIQDVGGHHGHHNIRTKDGEILGVNSIHHQMMCWNPEEMTDQPELLAWASPARSRKYIYKDDQNWTPPLSWTEPEFVYFPNVNGFAIQWHPEMMAEGVPATEFIINSINERLKNGATAQAGTTV